MHTDHLAHYVKKLPRGGLAKLARELGMSRVYLGQLAARQGGREPSPEACVRLEKQSGGEVRRWAMRPTDWHLIWPELIGAEGAPEVPTSDEVRDAA